ncbi:iron chelate uptake ABC transporter family permease subunit [Bacillus sp. A301a_S52]|nr:iron chelate uptake ABC transporter family permease subunit [Bacillus sp. A301a_S52]
MASQANIWITGSLNSVTWEDVNVLLPFTVILIILAFISSRNVNVQALGEDIATGVGSPVQRHRFILLMISSCLVGTAVAVAGGIGLVGLMAPHMVRKLVGSSFGSLLPVAAFIGATLVMLAYLVGRTLFLPSIVPAGVSPTSVFKIINNHSDISHETREKVTRVNGKNGYKPTFHDATFLT